MDSTPDRPAVVAGRYELEGLIGQGGMAQVFRARHLALDAHVAIKFLLLAADEAGRARFLTEARVTAQLKTRYAVQVFDFGVSEDGQPFLAMELLEGETLADRLHRAARLSRAETVRFVAQIARALERAHALGIVHRDLKPENLFVVRDEDGKEQIKVMDFGIAKLVGTLEPPPRAVDRPGSDASSRTSTGTRLGTPRYMAPEQVEAAEDIGPAADIWALGVVSFVCLTGRAPFDGPDVAAILDSVVRAAPPPARSFDRALPESFDAWFRRACAREPSARFEGPKEAARALARALDVTDEDLGLGESDDAADGPARAQIPVPLVASGPNDPPAGETPVTDHPRAHRRRARAALWILAGVGSIAATAAIVRAARERPVVAAASPSAARVEPPRPHLTFDVAGARRVTFGEDCEASPVFVGDGSTIAYAASRADGTHVALLDPKTGAETLLTSRADDDIVGVAPSPDGGAIAFLQLADESTYLLDTASPAAARKIYPGRARPSWSRDDPSALWVGSGSALALVGAADGETRRSIDVKATVSLLTTVETATGDLVATFANGTGGAGGVGVVAHDGTVRWLLQEEVAEVLALTRDGTAALVTRTRKIGGPELVALPLDGSAMVPLLSGPLTPTFGLSLSPDGRSAAWSTCASVTGLARVDASSTVTDLGPRMTWEDSAAYRIPGTDALLIVSSRGGKDGLWIIDTHGDAQPRRIATPDELTPTDIAVSPSGSLAAVRDASDGIYLVPLDGGAARKLVSGPIGLTLTFTRDGAEVLYTRRGKPRSVGAVDVRTGATRVLPLPPSAASPAASPVDDRVAYFAGRGAPNWELMIFDPRTGASTPLCPAIGVGPQGEPRFSPDGTRLAFNRTVTDLWEIDVRTCAVRKISAGMSQVDKPVYTSTGELMMVRSRFVGDVWVSETTGL